MKRFSYRFSRILRVKELKEEQEKQALGREMSVLQELLGVKRSLEAERDGVYQAMRDLQSAGLLDIPRLVGHRSQVTALQSRIERQQERVDTQQKVVEIHQQKVSEAMKQRKTFEKIKEHDLEDWKKLFAAEENALLDEIGGRGKQG